MNYHGVYPPLAIKVSAVNPHTYPIVRQPQTHSYPPPNNQAVVVARNFITYPPNTRMFVFKNFSF